MRGTAIDVAVDVDLHAVERLFSDQIVPVADLVARKQIAHQIVERLHQPPDDVLLPRMKREMAGELFDAIHAPREHRVRRLDRLDEQRIRQRRRGRGVDGPGKDAIARRCLGQRGRGQLAGERLVLGTDDRHRVGSGKPEPLCDHRRNQGAVLLVRADDTGDAGTPVSPYETIDETPHVEPEDLRIFREAKQVKALANHLELATQRGVSLQCTAVPAVGKQKEELGLHPAAAASECATSARRIANRGLPVLHLKGSADGGA